MNRLDDSAHPVDSLYCPFIGLHDDPGTCLSYPSFWNYCYRAKPPASVKVSHQTTACLSGGFVHCPVYLSPPKAPLPSGLRGSVPLKKRRPAALGLALLILFAIAVVLVDRSLGSGKLLRTFGGGGNAAANGATQAVDEDILPPFMAPQNPVTDTPMQGFLPLTSSTRAATRTPASIQPAAATFSPPSAFTNPITSTTLPAGVCGHALDAPFGQEVRFVLHRVRSGENLSMYAAQHHTTTEAILAVNYRLPVPVWEHWILVIPIDTAMVNDIPPFEPYQALGARLTLAELAENLTADPAALQQFNAFDESCTSFFGWILVPREADPR